jgi:cysteine desulfurase
VRIYLDNAATTPLDERVLEAMLPYLSGQFGNPSSIHGHGREARNAVERARKLVAGLLNCAPSEIFFTSGGTESDNTALRQAVRRYGIAHAITSPLEHHAVLHTLEDLHRSGHLELHRVEFDEKGHIRPEHLESLLRQYPGALVSLMHGNNEIGNLTDIGAVAAICAEYRAYFHSDTVQTLGHYALDLEKTLVHALAGSAHKFHGPKGTGILYLRGSHPVDPLLTGGSQERNMRGGTENVAGIVGLARALELACAEMAENRTRIAALKARAIDRLRHALPEAGFHGDSADPDRSLYRVLNVRLPGVADNDMLLFSLDIKGISVSGGSACSSGSSIGSHVLDALGVGPGTGAVRVSFSRFNTPEEIDTFVEALTEILKPV